MGSVAEKVLGPNLEKWFQLSLSCFFSWFISFCGAMGAGLIADWTWKHSLGWALLSGATMLFAVLMRSPLAKQLWIVVNAQVQQEYAKGGFSVTDGTKH